ncbi:lysophospholipid acyltransferase family protein [Desulfacinum hydrothermale]|nr:lysophospholipid acyltransferase family protein [Desulfacinum hydrothermale]
MAIEKKDRAERDNGARWPQVLGSAWHALDAKHRRTAEANIRMALGLNAQESRRLARENFRHLARVFSQFPLMARMNRENFLRFVEPCGTEYLLESLQRGRGVLILTGHLGNWEWMAYSAPFFLPARLNIVARPVRPEALHRWVTRTRQGSGNRVIPKQYALIHTLKALRRNEMVGFLLDQNAGKKTGVWAPFFGGYVLTHKTLAHIALRTGAPVHPVFNHRLPDGRYRIEMGPEIPTPSHGTLEEKAAVFTAAFNRIIEAQIRRFPAQWYWVHRRFRRFRLHPPS